MKARYIVIPLVLIILIVAGYFVYTSFQSSSKYELVSENEMNPSDFIFPGGIKQVDQGYIGQNGNFNVRVIEFSNINDATESISKMKEMYNPAMIGLAGKYVNYKEGSPGNHMYFYQSGKYIIFITNFVGDKNAGDAFIIWFYSKYPNKMS